MKITEAMKQLAWDAFTDDGHGDKTTYSDTLSGEIHEAFTATDDAPGWQWESQNPTTRTRWRNVAEYGVAKPSVHDLVHSALGGARIRYYTLPTRVTETGDGDDVAEVEKKTPQWIMD